MSGLGASANVTFLDGSLSVPDRGNTPFPEQSDLLWGAQLFYQYGPVEASVAYHHTGRALIGIASDPIEDQHNDNLRRLDTKISFDIGDHFTVFAQGQNLTNEPTRQYQGGNPRLGHPTGALWAGVLAGRFIPILTWTGSTIQLFANSWAHRAVAPMAIRTCPNLDCDVPWWLGHQGDFANAAHGLANGR